MIVDLEKKKGKSDKKGASSIATLFIPDQKLATSSK
jgi:hypothetical protein